MLVALVLLLIDAIREISIYKTRLNSSNDPQHGALHYGPTMELVKEFRAQRNFYIAGTALFLWLYVDLPLLFKFKFSPMMLSKRFEDVSFFTRCKHIKIKIRFEKIDKLEFFRLSIEKFVCLIELIEILG